MKEISVIGGQPHGHAALPLAAESLCGAPFQGTQPIRAPHSPFLQEPYGKWGARAQKRDFCFFSIFLERFLQSFQSGVNSKEGDNAAGIVPLFAIV